MICAVVTRRFIVSFLGLASVLPAAGCGMIEMQTPGVSPAPSASVAPADSTLDNTRRMVEEGRRTFWSDTFGSEAFWADAIQLHRAIAGDKHGGVGSGVSPKTALGVGLKVDSEALPASLADQIKKGAVNLDDPAATLALLKLDAVVGVKVPVRQRRGAGLHGHHLRLVPLDGGRLVRAGHRTSARRLGEP
jgi:hypothetical protein